jgi:peptidoglycan hydrolase CwlO-like protein
MTSRRRTHHDERPLRGLSRLAVPVAVTAALSVAAVVPLASSADPSISRLNSSLGAERAHAQHLASSVGALSHLIASLSGQISLVETREAAVRAQLEQDRARLRAVGVELDRERARLAVLRRRLAHARTILSDQLVSSYEHSRPDLVTVLLDAHGFADLLNRITYLRRAESQQQTLIQITRSDKQRADAAASRLAEIEAKDRAIAAGEAVRVKALAGMNALLHSRQAAVNHARAAQQAALDAARAHGAHLQAQITHLEARQAAAARAAAASAATPPAAALGATGGSGGWAIPYSIVLCESGGQNLPPNSAGASGYYQIVPGTWRLFAGTGPAAYLATKAEQDAVASRIWNGGAGASNWVCAGIVGIH